MDFNLFETATKTKENEGIYARFYDRVIKTNKIDEAGFPIFETCLYVEIKMKDNTTEIFNQRADKDKIKRFPLEYALYQQQKEQEHKGTPLSQYAFLSLSQIEALKARGIFTIQELSALEEEKVRQLGIQKEVHLAQKFIDFTKNSAVLLKWEEQEKKLKDEIKTLQEKITVLSRKKNKKGGKNA
ncbi:MAG: hypothetical protein PHI50_03295 [Alphaproteobacteria bacterium]|nr:hypothetical protein [Alphaproteobacteria bacterium]